MMEFVFDGLKNIVGKEENAVLLSESLKVGIV